MKVKIFHDGALLESQKEMDLFFSNNKDIEIYKIVNGGFENTKIYIYYEEGKKDSIGFK